MKRAISHVRDLTLDTIFPPRCAGCADFCASLFCADCHATLRPIVAPLCVRCGAPFDPLAHAAAECADCRANCYHAAPPFAAIRSAFAFEGALRPAVHALKYRGKVARAAPLSALLGNFLGQDGAIPRDELALIAPVPLHRLRRWRRGYNQSELLARELGKTLGVPCGDVLRRTRRTRPQVRLSEKQRLANVKGAFAADASALARHNPSRGPVLLIDDVYTTGATLGECARALRAAGIAEIYALTLARQL